MSEVGGLAGLLPLEGLMSEVEGLAARRWDFRGLAGFPADLPAGLLPLEGLMSEVGGLAGLLPLEDLMSEVGDWGARR